MRGNFRADQDKMWEITRGICITVAKLDISSRFDGSHDDGSVETLD